MPRTAHLVLMLLPFLIACGAGAPAISAADGEAPGAYTGPDRRLRASGEALAITALPQSPKAPQGALFYVLSEQLTQSQVRPRIGIVELTDPASAKVAWYCKPNQPIEKALAGPGLPVRPFKADPEARAGKCWGSYRAQAPEAWDKSRTSMVYLPINIGEADGVRAGDLFDVLTNPGDDKDNLTVKDFKRIGRCSIQPIEISEHASVCRLDRKAWPAFSRDAWARDGFVKLAEQNP
jgi:hypothetical protein